MTNTFNVLDRHFDLNHHYLVEASAGTGKTFSIENIVVRLLLEQEPLQLQQILVVTFTRAATRDLKLRIRTNIVQAIAHLQNPLHNQMPDYLRAIVEQGEERVSQAKKQLDYALFCFDQAQIFTIHSFCSRMLKEHLVEGDATLESAEEEQLSNSFYVQLVRDFLRTGLDRRHYSTQQMRILFKGQTADQLKKSLVKTLRRGLDIAEGVSYDEHFKAFKQEIARLKALLGLSSEKILQDYEEYAKIYKVVHSSKEDRAAIEHFSSLFDKESWKVQDFDLLLEHGLLLTSFKENKKGKTIDPSHFHYPTLISQLKEKLAPLIFEAGSPVALFGRLASDCQKHLRRCFDEEERMDYDDILKAMRTATSHSLFVEKVRGCYKAAIVDEFQDTDPLQWEIFKKLFLVKEGHWGSLFLVGDPKQSIYSFRQADIYTYLSAAEALSVGSRSILETNYRSQPELVKALNRLFNSTTSPGLIDLPRLNIALPYLPIKAGAPPLAHPFQDNMGSLHFFIADQDKEKKQSIAKLEKEYLIPFVLHEILRLARKGYNLSKFAILVKDRYQAERVLKALEERHIPALNQRNTPLADTIAFDAFREVMMAVLNPRHDSLLKTALGGTLIGWTHDQILLLKDPLFAEQVLLKFFILHTVLHQKGFATFYQQLMETQFLEGTATLSTQLLSREGGIDLYDDFLQIAELLTSEQRRTGASPENLLIYLDELKWQKEGDEESALMQRLPTDQEAVQLLTIHKSKGLEFDIVFALGLVSRPIEPDFLIPVANEKGHFSLHACQEEDPRYLNYCEEVDAEKMRQFYVAITRAKERVYLPVLFNGEFRIVPPGTASPMEVFTSRFGSDHSAAALQSFLETEAQEYSITSCHLNQFSFDLQPLSKTFLIELCPPKQVEIVHKPEFIYSYTALSKGLARKESTSVFEPPHQFFVEEKNPHTFPSSNIVGTLLHKVLEKIDFKSVAHAQNSQQIIPLITRFLIASPFEGWKEVIAEIVYNALHTALPFQGGEKKPLSILDPAEIYRETEFIYPWDRDFRPPELEPLPGFLKGVIDLVFQHEGKFYLLDWKSNWLGPTCEDYSSEAIIRAMEENHYFLQAAVYREALRRFIQFYSRRPFEEVFGGIYYIFLRGLNPTSTAGNGIYGECACQV